MKEKLMKLIFGKHYKKQTVEFWKKFWHNKWLEIFGGIKGLCKVIIIGIILPAVAIFIFIWCPAFLYIHKEFKFVYPKEYSTNVIDSDIERTNSIIYACKFNTTEMQEDFLTKFNSLTRDYNSKTKSCILVRGGDSEVISAGLDDIIYWSIGDMHNIQEITGEQWPLYSYDNYPKSRSLIQKLIKDKKLGTFQNIEVSFPSGNIITTTNITEVKHKLNTYEGGTWLFVIFIIVTIYAGIVIIGTCLRGWLKSNYEKMIGKKK